MNRQQAVLPPIDDFLARSVVSWQLLHGRHDLPWQNTRDPYRVWLSEVMLQQTQVATVLTYFDRFLRRFPTVTALAEATLDEVLGLWTGLGYYSRARNLHRCAQQVVQEHAGRFPASAQQLQALSGIGPSTAAAITSLCFGERVAILDGNVKRVLTRYLGFAHDLSVAGNERLLWQQAQALLPVNDVAQAMPRYTQGMMDLGATLCTAKNPACQRCPLQVRCVAAETSSPQDFPVKTRRIKRSAESIWLLWASDAAGAVWLQQRPTPGVWAGLYCFALFETEHDLRQAVPQPCQAHINCLPALKHVLTHKDMYLHLCKVVLPSGCEPVAPGAWFSPSQWPGLGMPAPVHKWLQRG